MTYSGVLKYAFRALENDLLVSNNFLLARSSSALWWSGRLGASLPAESRSSFISLATSLWRRVTVTLLLLASVYLLDDLQKLVPLIDQARQFVESSPEGRGPPAEVARQGGGVGGLVRVRVCPGWGGGTPAVVPGVLPLTHHTRPHLAPPELHCGTSFVHMAVTSLGRGRPLGFLHKWPFWFWLLLLVRRRRGGPGARSDSRGLSGHWTRRGGSGPGLQELSVLLSFPRQTAVMVSMTVTVVVSGLWRRWWYGMPAWWWIGSSHKSQHQIIGIW